jgi:hypothetical protein
MGLDCSHDAFHGAYSAFNRFRQFVAKTAGGGSFSPHEDKSLDDGKWYWGSGYSKSTHPGLYEFFMHSDCDGDISPKMCTLIADELDALLPLMSTCDSGGGHIERDGGYVAVTKRFIKGCRDAAAANEVLEFH